MIDSALIHRVARFLGVVFSSALLLTGCGGDEATKSGEPAGYDVDIYNGWPQTADERKVGQFVESEWYDPANAQITIAIDSRSVEDSGTPSASAELALVQTSKLPGYRERGMKRIRLSGRPTIRWAFDVAGESHVEFFFEECDTLFVVRGTTIPVAFEGLSESFHNMALTIKAKCDE